MGKTPSEKYPPFNLPEQLTSAKRKKNGEGKKGDLLLERQKKTDFRNVRVETE